MCIVCAGNPKKFFFFFFFCLSFSVSVTLLSKMQDLFLVVPLFCRTSMISACRLDSTK